MREEKKRKLPQNNQNSTIYKVKEKTVLKKCDVLCKPSTSLYATEFWDGWLYEQYVLASSRIYKARTNQQQIQTTNLSLKYFLFDLFSFLFQLFYRTKTDNLVNVYRALKMV